MSAKDDKAYLTHILESMATLSRHLRRKQANVTWHEDELVRDAALRTLQTMSESCMNLSPEAKAMAPEVNWKAIANFHHILVHDYLGNINYVRVTEVIDLHLPILETAVSRIYKARYA